MSLLQHLRQTPHIAMGVLAWLVLSIGVATANPALKPSANHAGLGVVCSADPNAALLQNSTPVDFPVNGNHAQHAQTNSHGWDCVLCLHISTPLAQRPSWQHERSKSNDLVVLLPRVAPSLRLAAPPPGRGPPSSA